MWLVVHRAECKGYKNMPCMNVEHRVQATGGVIEIKRVKHEGASQEDHQEAIELQAPEWRGRGIRVRMSVEGRKEPNCCQRWVLLMR